MLPSHAGTHSATGTTAGQNNDYSASCNTGSNSDNAGPDVVYRLVLSAPMRLRARVTAGSSWTPLLYLSRTCDRFSSSSDRRLEGEAACATGGNSPQVDVTLPAGTWFVIVDGAGTSSSNAGAFTLDWTLSAAAGAAGYDLQSAGNQPCPAIPGGSTDLGLNDDDETTSARTLGFPFEFFGQAVTRYAVNSNGFVELLRDGANGTGGGRSWANTPLPNAGAPNGLIAPFWDDLYPDGSNRTRRWMTGSAPNRVEHFRWTDTRRFRDRDARLTFEARLYETSHRIEFLYCRLEGGSGPTDAAAARAGSATVGLEDLDGNRGFLISVDRPTLMPGLLLRFIPLPPG